jgi:Bacterial dnaA protein helix-turn-helix
MSKANGCLRLAEDDGTRSRPESEFNAGRICSISVIAVPCPTAADVRKQAAHVRALRAGAFHLRVVSPPVLEPRQPAPAMAPAFSAPAEQPPPVLGRITVRRVVEVTAEHFRTSVSELLSHRRPQPLCRRRQVAMYVARKMTGHSLPFIGRRMGGRDHTTILHGARVVKGLIEAGDTETIAAVDQIIERLQVTGGAHD